MKVIATFTYSADTIPRGSRKERRADLVGLTEFTFTEIGKREMIKDVMVVDAMPVSAAEPAERVRLSGWDGRLWAPLRNIDGDEDRLPLLKVKDYIDVLANSRSFYVQDEPLHCAFDRSHESKDAGSLNRDAWAREEAFTGKIMRSNRTESLRWHEEAVKSVVFVDGIVHVQQPEPVWNWVRWMNTPIATKIHLDPRPKMYLHDQFFRLDRADIMREWMTGRCKGDIQFRGRLVDFDPAYIKRDDVSSMLAAWLPGMTSSAKTSNLFQHLPAEFMSVWKSLVDIACDNGNPIVRGAPLRGDVDGTITKLRSLRDGLMNAWLPTEFLNERDEFVQTILAPLFDRLDFELARRPKRETTAVEDAAIAGLVT